jgi:hypothetical protein
VSRKIRTAQETKCGVRSPTIGGAARNRSYTDHIADQGCHDCLLPFIAVLAILGRFWEEDRGARGKKQSGEPLHVIGRWTAAYVRDGANLKIRMLSAFLKAPPPKD